MRQSDSHSCAIDSIKGVSYWIHHVRHTDNSHYVAQASRVRVIDCSTIKKHITNEHFAGAPGHFPSSANRSRYNPVTDQLHNISTNITHAVIASVA